MLSVWWDIHGVHFKLLPPNTTITADYYCQHLEESHSNAAAIPKDLFSAKLTFLKLIEMGWAILPHPPYPPDIPLSDLFRALQFHMSEKSFDDFCQLEADNPKFLEGSFYKDEFHSLPIKWRIVVDSKHDYILD